MHKSEKTPDGMIRTEVRSVRGRWLWLANPALARVITQAIGGDWVTDLTHLSKLKPLIDDGATIEMAQEAGEESFFLFGLTGDPRWSNTK